MHRSHPPRWPFAHRRVVENKTFELALARYYHDGDRQVYGSYGPALTCSGADVDTPLGAVSSSCRWTKIAALLPGKSHDAVLRHYELLEVRLAMGRSSLGAHSPSAVVGTSIVAAFAWMLAALQPDAPDMTVHPPGGPARHPPSHRKRQAPSASLWSHPQHAGETMPPMCTFCPPCTIQPRAVQCLSTAPLTLRP
jgi:hypothetical protein